KRVQGVPEEERDAAENAALLELLPESFAVVREAAKRVLNMRHFDVQLIGGMVLHDGKISEMRTGEGKTLVATLPAYLNALGGRGVHIVTVNDYLASRDAEWMGKVYKFLGLSVGVILTQMPHADKQSAYAADITYGTNNEFGFDYLRDNMAMQVGDRFQTGPNYAIVDEVDSIPRNECCRQARWSAPVTDCGGAGRRPTAAQAGAGRAVSRGSDVTVARHEPAETVALLVDPALEIEHNAYEQAFPAGFADVRWRVM